MHAFNLCADSPADYAVMHGTWLGTMSVWEGRAEMVSVLTEPTVY